jgi:hypothetical protein
MREDAVLVYVLIKWIQEAIVCSDFLKTEPRFKTLD